MIAQIKMRRGTTAEWAAASPVVLAAGEPGWDSTLKGMKVGDGATEWAALPWMDAKNRPDINADLLDGKHTSNAAGDIPISNGAVNITLNADLLDGVHLADIRLGQNLLHNSDFDNLQILLLVPSSVINFNDYSFTTKKELATKFMTEEGANSKIRRLSMFKNLRVEKCLPTNK